MSFIFDVIIFERWMFGYDIWNDFELKCCFKKRLYTMPYKARLYCGNCQLFMAIPLSPALWTFWLFTYMFYCRDFLLTYICRAYGLDMYQSLRRSDARWLFPSERKENEVSCFVLWTFIVRTVERVDNEKLEFVRIAKTHAAFNSLL